MLNNFGGWQDHPAYDPRTPTAPGQVLVGNDLFTVDCYGRVTVESVNGESWAAAPPYPAAVNELRCKLERRER